MTQEMKSAKSSATVAKARTGMDGLDEITKGGLPVGRPSLVCGGPGCGKTMLAMEFLVHGARRFNEPGLFVSFEENTEQIIENFRSISFDFEQLIQEKKLKISHIELSRGEIMQAGDFSLDAFLIRLEHSVAEVGAKRIVIDSMEAVFGTLADSERLRGEMARVFQWLRNRGLTAIVTGERGQGDLTRHGFEEYISDCVLLLDHRVSEQISKRRVRIVKYRGSGHATNEFPFLIDETGFSVLPITAFNLEYGASTERVSSGIPGVDEMLGGEGYFQATAVLISGTSGTGKSSLSASFAVSGCERGEKCLYFAFEESGPQIARNMQSVGINLHPWLANRLLTIRSSRPTFRGLEEHLVGLIHEIEKIRPQRVVMDPITSLMTIGDISEVKAMLTRTLDLLKGRGITLLMTSLSDGKGGSDESNMNLSSLVDTWIGLDMERQGNVRRRTIRVVKSRGMQHSHGSSELLMSAGGIAVSARQMEAPC